MAREVHVSLRGFAPLVSYSTAILSFQIKAKFENTAYARTAYQKSVSRHLRSGTTFASYFATIHRDSSQTLAEVIQAAGQRAFVGRNHNLILNIDCTWMNKLCVNKRHYCRQGVHGPQQSRFLCGRHGSWRLRDGGLRAAHSEADSGRAAASPGVHSQHRCELAKL